MAGKFRGKCSHRLQKTVAFNKGEEGQDFHGRLHVEGRGEWYTEKVGSVEERKFDELCYRVVRGVRGFHGEVGFGDGWHRRQQQQRELKKEEIKN